MVHTTAFIDFESNQHAKEALRALREKSEPGMQKLLIDFATAPIQLIHTSRLFLRVKGATSSADLEDGLSKLDGFEGVRFSEYLP